MVIAFQQSGASFTWSYVWLAAVAFLFALAVLAFGYLVARAQRPRASRIFRSSVFRSIDRMLGERIGRVWSFIRQRFRSDMWHGLALTTVAAAVFAAAYLFALITESWVDVVSYMEVITHSSCPLDLGRGRRHHHRVRLVGIQPRPHHGSPNEVRTQAPLIANGGNVKPFATIFRTHMKANLFVSLFLLLASTAACSRDRDAATDPDLPASRTSTVVDTSGSSFAYDFERPDRSVELHDDLREISGLTVFADGRLGAVQDEEGSIFVLDAASGAVLERHTFADEGDYEGIELVNDQVFILRSDGTLFDVSEWESENADAREIETSLRERNDTEGLGFDPSGDRLLIACKEQPGADLGGRFKAIYAFDLVERRLLPNPAYTIDRDEIEGRIDGDGNFKPSALAVHPIDGSLYVLSSTAKSIAVLGRGGDLVDVHPLPEDLFEQPEGLAFLSDGTLYVASEAGDRDSAMLHAFAPSEGGE